MPKGIQIRLAWLRPFGLHNILIAIRDTSIDLDEGDETEGNDQSEAI
jgi:hypothetical protein